MGLRGFTSRWVARAVTETGQNTGQLIEVRRSRALGGLARFNPY